MDLPSAQTVKKEPSHIDMSLKIQSHINSWKDSFVSYCISILYFYFPRYKQKRNPIAICFGFKENR